MANMRELLEREAALKAELESLKTVKNDAKLEVLEAIKSAVSNIDIPDGFTFIVSGDDNGQAIIHVSEPRRASTRGQRYILSDSNGRVVSEGSLNRLASHVAPIIGHNYPTQGIPADKARKWIQEAVSSKDYRFEEAEAA